MGNMDNDTLGGGTARQRESRMMTGYFETEIVLKELIHIYEDGSSDA